MRQENVAERAQLRRAGHLDELASQLVGAVEVTAVERHIRERDGHRDGARGLKLASDGRDARRVAGRVSAERAHGQRLVAAGAGIEDSAHQRQHVLAPPIHRGDAGEMDHGAHVVRLQRYHSLERGTRLGR
jgi:hypothetical protein